MENYSYVVENSVLTNFDVSFLNPQVRYIIDSHRIRDLIQDVSFSLHPESLFEFQVKLLLKHSYVRK